jgi:hypothetical protein
MDKKGSANQPSEKPKSFLSKAIPAMVILFIIAAVTAQFQPKTPPETNAGSYSAPAATPPPSEKRVSRVSTNPPKVAQATSPVPQHKIIRAVDALDGRKVGYVLTPTLSQKTPVAERKRVLTEIMKVYGFSDATIYKNEGAYKWDRNSDYQDLHKDAWKGIVMIHSEGKFIVPEEFHGP